MKNYYTKEEIDNLTNDELVKLMTFGPNNEFFYSEISTMIVDDMLYIITLKDGSEIEASIDEPQSAEKFNNIKLGKVRYDLISKTLNEVTEEKEMREELFKDIKEELNDMVNKVKEENKESIENIAMSSKIMLNNLKTMTDNLTDSATDMSDQAIDKLKSIDSDLFKDKMKKVDKIVDAFSDLLK